MPLNGTMCIARAKCRVRPKGIREEAVLLTPSQGWPVQLFGGGARQSHLAVDSFVEHSGH